MCDDLSCSSDEDDLLAEQTWKKTTNQINKAGYREGLDAGKEEVLQEGFNKAFSISSQMLFKVAELRGRISSKLSCSLLKVGHLDKKQESKLQALLLDVVKLESDLLRFSAVKFTDWLYDSSEKASSTGNGVVSSEKLDCVQNQHCTTTCDKVEDEASDISELDSKQLQTFENRSEEDKGKDVGQNDKSGDVYDTSVTDCSIEASESDILTTGTVQSKLSALSEKFFSIVNSQG